MFDPTPTRPTGSDVDTHVVGPQPDSLDQELLDEPWLADTHRRSRARVVLLALLSAALVFLAGAQVQRHFGATSSQSGAAATIPASGTGFPGGIPSGAGIPGASGNIPGGGGGAAQGSVGDESDQGTVGDGTGSAAVIGEVVSVKGDTWIVKDLGGKKHTVTVASSTTVVRQQHVSARTVKPGQTVNVSGAARDGNRISAATITVQ